MGDYHVKNLDPNTFYMEFEFEWDEATKIMTTQEEKSAEIDKKSK